MGFGGFLARPFKDVGKAVKKVGGGVNKVGKSAVKAVGRVGKGATGAIAGAGKAMTGIGPSDKAKKKMMQTGGTNKFKEQL